MFIPDGFKPEVIKFLASPAGKALIIAARLRRPVAPSSTETAHGMIQRYANSEGYELAFEQLSRIPQESPKEGEVVELDPFKILQD